MAMFFDEHTDVGLCGETVAVMFGAEGFDVTTTRADGKGPHVIYLEFSYWLLPNLQQFSREDRTWRKRWGSGFRRCWGVAWFDGAHSLPILEHVSFEHFVCVRNIFSGAGHEA